MEKAPLPKSPPPFHKRVLVQKTRKPPEARPVLIVHELVHTKIKNHSKEFWAELSKHIPDWKELDARMYGMKL